MDCSPLETAEYSVDRRSSGRLVVLAVDHNILHSWRMQIAKAIGESTVEKLRRYPTSD